jgi:hypothetical protein
MTDDTTKEKLENMVGALAHIRLRPQMYAGSREIDVVHSFLNGFYFAFSFWGLTINETENQFMRERGWIISSGGLVAVMKEKGLSNQEMTDEMFTILILALVRQYELSIKPILKVHAEIRERAEKMLSRVDETRYQNELDMMSQLEKDLGII